jgi:hypothetical protein
MWREGRPLRQGSLGPPSASGPDPGSAQSDFPRELRARTPRMERCRVTKIAAVPASACSRR